MNYKKMYFEDYVIILDKKLNCFRAFENRKVKKNNELSIRYIINSKRLELFENKDLEFIELTIKSNSAFGVYEYSDGSFIIA